jgi:hypothetical protein
VLEVYNPEGQPERTVTLYMSEALKGRFRPDQFIGGEPGQFIVFYEVNEGRVTLLVIAIGNNP